MKTVLLWFGAAAMALGMAACASQQQQTLQPGMTPDQAITAMGEPDLKDSVAAPGQTSQKVLRYTWLQPGEAAVFSPDNRLAEIQRVSSNDADAAAQAQAAQPSTFDPISTPLDYTFYPVRAAFIYLGAGLNCLGGGGCRQPKLPPASRG